MSDVQQPRSLLHILPRCIGGGPERSVLAAVKETRALGVSDRHAIVVLDPPVSPEMFLQARRLGVEVFIGPDEERLVDLCSSVDIVLVQFWNHPALFDLLGKVELPACRVIVVSRVLGTTAPQMLTSDVGTFGDRLIVTSRRSAAAEGYRAAKAAGTPVDFVPGLADFSRLDGFTPEPHDGFVAGYLGSTNAAKMHPRLPEMYARIDQPHVRFVICGGGGGEDDLRRRFVELGIGHRADVRGHVEDIAAALAGMDVFAYPLSGDTYATSDKTVQEAMWAGLPPVVLAGSGPADLVEHEVTGLVAETEEEFSFAVARLASDPALTVELGLRARQYARREFDPARWTRKLRRIVADLCEQEPRRRAKLPVGASAASGFVTSLGEAGGHFGKSLLGEEVRDEQIAASSLVEANGEGGVVHYRNHFPDDPHLRLWSGLIAERAGANQLAAEEYRAAKTLGLDDGRPERYTQRAVSRPTS